MKQNLAIFLFAIFNTEEKIAFHNDINDIKIEFDQKFDKILIFTNYLNIFISINLFSINNYFIM